MLVALIWLNAKRGKHDTVTAPLMSVFTISITVTNWTAGIWAAVLAIGVRRAITISAASLLIVVLLSFVQKSIYPSAGELFDFSAEGTWVELRPDLMGRLVSFFHEPFVAPDPEIFQIKGKEDIIVGFPPDSVGRNRSGLGFLSGLGWALLFLMAIEAIVKSKVDSMSLVFILGVLIGQFVLHSVYGPNPFLYSLHFTPFLVLVAAHAFRGDRFRLACGVGFVTAVATLIHNLSQLGRATWLFDELSVRLLV